MVCNIRNWHSIDYYSHIKYPIRCTIPIFFLRLMVVRVKKMCTLQHTQKTNTNTCTDRLNCLCATTSEFRLYILILNCLLTIFNAVLHYKQQYWLNCSFFSSTNLYFIFLSSNRSFLYAAIVTTDQKWSVVFGQYLFHSLSLCSFFFFICSARSLSFHFCFVFNHLNHWVFNHWVFFVA